MRVGMGLEKVRAYLEENKPRHVARIQRAVQQASVSSEDLGVVECADLLAEIHREAGFQEAEVVATDGLPGLWAAYDAGAPKTIIVYNNFDTRPVLPNEKWEHPPYSGALTSAGPYGQVVMGRGAMSKGGYIAWLNALEALLAVEGTLPVNVLTLLEGDEILGSPNFRGMYAKYRDRLATATASLSPGANQDAAGRVSLTLGYKGMIYAELVASGARWGRGPQSAPLHGMTASVVDSPAWRLVHALASLMEPGGNRIAVPGYYDDVAPPTDEERRAAYPSPGPWNKVLPGVAAAPVPLGDLSDEETVMNFFYGAEPEHQRPSQRFHRPRHAPLQPAARGLGPLRHPRASRIQGAGGHPAHSRAPGRAGLPGPGLQCHGGLRPLDHGPKLGAGAVRPPGLPGDGRARGQRAGQRGRRTVVDIRHRPGPAGHTQRRARRRRRGWRQRVPGHRRHGRLSAGWWSASCPTSTS